MNKKIGKVLCAVFLLASTNIFASAYNNPPPNESLIGQVQYNTAEFGKSATDIAVQYDLGFNAIESANPHLNMARRFSYGSEVIIPTQHLLPDQPRKGIVVNVAEMRMYYYPEGSNQVFTYPIGIGKIGKTIPLARTKIVRKATNPIWIPPDDIREWNLTQGVVLPKIMQPGPDNPLGPYAIYTGIPTYLIHSTIFPESVGKRASFGCIRMYEADIKTFFPAMKKGIPLTIINAPVKVGWQQDRLYIEAHQPLEEDSGAYEASLAGAVHTIHNVSKDQPVLVDWQMVSFATQQHDGLPHEVGMKIPQS